MDPNEFIESVSREIRPKPNIEGDFDCHTCMERVDNGFYDYAEGILWWWCSKEHRSHIKVKL
jgi:hypothetical protein